MRQEEIEKVVSDTFKEHFIWENEFYKFYHDGWCDQYKKDLTHYDIFGYAVDVKAVYLAKSKEGKGDVYVAYNTLGVPFLTWKDSFDFEIQTLLHKSALKEQNDIVNMAKKKGEK